MKILFITSRFPYPPIKGDKIRAFYPIKMLSNEHQIDLLSFSMSFIQQSYLEEMKQYCQHIEVINISKFKYYFSLFFGVFSNQPSQVLCYQSIKMRSYIKKILKTKKYDIVHIVAGRLSMYSKLIDNTPIIIDWIDCFYLAAQRMYNNEKNIIKKYAYYFESKKMKAYEIKYLSKSNYSIITSKIDKYYLDDIINEVIPNGVDTSVFKSLQTHKDIDLIFTGNMGYFPNRKAIDYFFSNIFPQLIKQLPSITFYIVGINSDKYFSNYHDGKNIFVTGRVDNIATFLNRSKIFIAPLQSGTGIQNKILEAMACSLPVISTSYGNGGIGAKNNFEILITDYPNDFVSAIYDLIGNEEKRIYIGNNANIFVKSFFSWQSAVNRINEIYKELVFQSQSHTIT